MSVSDVDGGGAVSRIIVNGVPVSVSDGESVRILPGAEPNTVIITTIDPTVSNAPSGDTDPNSNHHADNEHRVDDALARFHNDDYAHDSGSLSYPEYDSDYRPDYDDDEAYGYDDEVYSEGTDDTYGDDGYYPDLGYSHHGYGDTHHATHGGWRVTGIVDSGNDSTVDDNEHGDGLSDGTSARIDDDIDNARHGDTDDIVTSLYADGLYAPVLHFHPDYLCRYTWAVDSTDDRVLRQLRDSDVVLPSVLMSRDASIEGIVNSALNAASKTMRVVDHITASAGGLVLPDDEYEQLYAELEIAMRDLDSVLGTVTLAALDHIEYNRLSLEELNLVRESAEMLPGLDDMLNDMNAVTVFIHEAVAALNTVYETGQVCNPVLHQDEDGEYAWVLDGTEAYLLNKMGVRVPRLSVWNHDVHTIESGLNGVVRVVNDVLDLLDSIDSDDEQGIMLEKYEEASEDLKKANQWLYLMRDEVITHVPIEALRNRQNLPHGMLGTPDDVPSIISPQWGLNALLEDIHSVIVFTSDVIIALCAVRDSNSSGARDADEGTVSSEDSDAISEDKNDKSHNHHVSSDGSSDDSHSDSVKHARISAGLRGVSRLVNEISDRLGSIVLTDISDDELEDFQWDVDAASIASNNIADMLDDAGLNDPLNPYRDEYNEAYYRLERIAEYLVEIDGMLGDARADTNTSTDAHDDSAIDDTDDADDEYEWKVGTRGALARWR